MSTASSASDRIEQARAALEAYDRTVETYQSANGDNDPDVQDYEEYEDSIMDTHMPEVAKALRSMIEPSAIDETPEQVADEWDTHLRTYGLVVTFGLDAVLRPDAFALYREAYLAGVRRGIVMGWNSWEPETAPGLPSGTIEQLVTEAREMLPSQDVIDSIEDGEAWPRLRKAYALIERMVDELGAER